MSKASVVDGFWVGGVNSLLYSAYLKPTEYAWATNVDNSGGIVQTRQGFSRMPGLESLEAAPQLARGMTIFKGRGGTSEIIIARGSQLLHSQYPFNGTFTQLPGVSWRNTRGPVTFVTAIKSINRDAKGNEVFVDPYPVLIIQDGQGRAVVWDGTTLVESDPGKRTGAFGIPVGLWGQWSGNRYWVAAGNHVHSSNLGDPTTFTEEDNISGGGILVMPDTVTAMAQTPDFRNLLIFTGNTTTSVQSGITDRVTWGSTNEFQKVIFPGIGCAAGKSIVSQYGMTWWYSHNGLIGMDQALNTYRSSRITYRDSEMARSKGNLNSDVSGICCGSFGNYLTVSAPSGDTENAHTWILNQSVVPSSEYPGKWSGAWTGVRPVEWVTAVINGENRCFFLSNDYGIGAQGFSGEIKYYTNVWESFIGERMDHSTMPKPIQCVLETRTLGVSETFKALDWVELELSEISGVVDLEVYFSGIRGGYVKIMDKRISATPGSFNGPEGVAASTLTTQSEEFFLPDYVGPILDPDLDVVSTTGFANSGQLSIGDRIVTYTSKTSTKFIGASVLRHIRDGVIPSGTMVTQRLTTYDPNDEAGGSDLMTSYRPQFRTVRSKSVESDTTCISCPVESFKNNNIDRGFSFLIKWTGKMAITGLRMVYSNDKDYQQGTCEEDEDSARYVKTSGCGEILEDVVQPQSSTFGNTKSRYMQIISPKVTDDYYSSFIP